MAVCIQMTLWKLPSEIPLIVRLAPTLWRASNLKRSSGAWSHSIISGHFHNQSVEKNMETPSVTTFRNSAKGFTEHKNIWQHLTHSAPASGFCHCICNFCSARDFVLKTSNISQHLLTQQSSWGEGLGICNFNCVCKSVMLEPDMCLHSLDCGESIHLDFLSKERGISNVPEQNAHTSDDRIKLHLLMWWCVASDVSWHSFIVMTTYIYLLPVDLLGLRISWLKITSTIFNCTMALAPSSTVMINQCTSGILCTLHRIFLPGTLQCNGRIAGPPNHIELASD